MNTSMPFLQFFDDAGRTIKSGKIYTYVAGTDIPKNAYSDWERTIPMSNPIELTAGARADIFWGLGYYRLVLTDLDDVIITERDHLELSEDYDAEMVGAEPTLPIPSSLGKVLTSDTSGVKSWIDQPTIPPYLNEQDVLNIIEGEKNQSNGIAGLNVAGKIEWNLVDKTGSAASDIGAVRNAMSIPNIGQYGTLPFVGPLGVGALAFVEGQLYKSTGGAWEQQCITPSDLPDYKHGQHGYLMADGLGNIAWSTNLFPANSEGYLYNDGNGNKTWKNVVPGDNPIHTYHTACQPASVIAQAGTQEIAYLSKFAMVNANPPSNFPLSRPGLTFAAQAIDPFYFPVQMKMKYLYVSAYSLAVATSNRGQNARLGMKMMVTDSAGNVIRNGDDFEIILSNQTGNKVNTLNDLSTTPAGLPAVFGGLFTTYSAFDSIQPGWSVGFYIKLDGSSDEKISACRGVQITLICEDSNGGLL